MATTLRCTQCNYENESERIYCHNCGVKLDRSVLPEEVVTKSSKRQSSRRVRKLMRPGSGAVRKLFRSLLFLVIWSVIAASLIQMARTPDGVPPEKQGLADAPQLRLVLEDVTASPIPRRLGLSAEVINGYLHNTIKSAASTVSAEMKFVRCFVNLEPGVCHVTTEQSVFGWPIFTGSAYALEIRDGKLRATNAGGNMGRLPVHPKIMAYADIAFQKVWDALKQERRLLTKMQSIEVNQDQIILVSNPAARNTEP